jgi:hypothetical protein
MKRVSTSMRVLRPGWAATLRSVNTPAIWGFFSIGTVPVAPGMPTKSAPTLPALAHRCSVLHAPSSTACRGATAATESRNATTTVSALARTNRPLRLESIPAGGMVEKTRPPVSGRVATAWHGMDASSARGAPDTSGAVTSVISPSEPTACGQAMVAVVCRTGSSGVITQSSKPAMPATIAMSRVVRAGTTLKGMRRVCVGCGAMRCQLSRSGPGLHSPLRVAVPSSMRAGWAFG